MVSLREIRAYAERITAEFKPRRIILFGSHAYGTPNEHSDVDLLVVFSGRGRGVDRALEIRLKLDYAGFPMDLLTRTEREVQRRIEMNDWFMREIVEHGKVLYDAGQRVDRKGRGRLRGRTARAARTTVSGV